MYALSQQKNWYGLVERMDSMATHGLRIWDTSLGKQLMQLVPEGTTRVVVDISLDDVVKIYYEVNHSEPILNLDWAKAFDSATLVALKRAERDKPADAPDKSKVETVPETTEAETKPCKHEWSLWGSREERKEGVGPIVRKLNGVWTEKGNTKLLFLFFCNKCGRVKVVDDDAIASMAEDMEDHILNEDKGTTGHDTYSTTTPLYVSSPGADPFVSVANHSNTPEYYKVGANHSTAPENDSNELAGIPDKSKAEAVPENGAGPFVSVANHSNAPEYYTVRRELRQLLGENK